MYYCPRCREKLIDGQVLCPRCGYDQRTSVGRAGLTPGILVLVILLGLLLIPAAGVAFFVTCFAAALVVMSGGGPNGDAGIVMAYAAGLIAALLVFALGGWLIYWLINRKRHPSEWTSPAPTAGAPQPTTSPPDPPA